MRIGRRGKLLASIAALAMVGAAVAGAIFVITATNDTDSAGPIPNDEERDPTSLELLYQYQSTLYSAPVAVGDAAEPGTGEEVTGIEGVAAEAAPGSRFIASFTGDPGSGTAAPVLNLFDPDSGAAAELGPGLHPTWNASGDRLAYLRPADPDNCTLERCPDGGEVVALDPSTPSDADVVLETGSWEPALWAGAHLLVADTTASEEFAVVAPDGGVTTTEMNHPLAASPDGEWLLLEGSGTEPDGFVRFADGEVRGELIAIEKGELETFTEVRWSPDSDRVAAVLRSGAGGRVVLMSPDDPTPEPIEGSDGAVGRLMWSRHGDALAFSSLAEDDEGRAALQAQFCVLDTGDCSAVLQWQQAVSILRLQ